MFNVQNLIKIQVRNKLRNINLEAMLRVSLEGPNKNFDNIIEETIPL